MAGSSGAEAELEARRAEPAELEARRGGPAAVTAASDAAPEPVDAGMKRVPAEGGPEDDTEELADWSDAEKERLKGSVDPRRTHVLLSPLGQGRADEEKPIVILISWNNASWPYVSKYAEVWNARGADVIAFCPTYRETYSVRGNSRLAKKMLSLAAALCAGKRRPIFFHLFSGGCYTFWAMMEMISRDFRFFHSQPVFDGLAECCAGAVFDSTPIDPDPAVAAYAVASLTISYKSPFIKLASLPIEGALRLWWRLYMRADIRVAQRLFWEELRKPPVAMPQLFLYSEDDAVSDWRVIAAHAEHLRRSYAEPIFEQRWRSSRHVQHFRAHPREYIEAMDRFLSAAMARWKQRAPHRAPGPRLRARL
eukprot:tig00000093_g3631.t1